MKNSQKLLSMRALALPLILAFQSAHAASIVAADDNYVLNSASSTVQNADGNLVLKRASNNIRKSWLKFDLTGQNVDFSQSGTVTLTLAGDSSSDTSFKIALYALDDVGATAPTWTESTITWNNAPGNDTGGTGINDLEPGETTFISETATISNNTAAGTQYQFVIPDLSVFLQSDNTITTIAIASVQPNSGPSLALASSENATESWRPTLTFTAVPEPGSFALLSGMLALTWVALGRRRVH